MNVVYFGRGLWLTIFFVTLTYILRVSNGIPLADEWRWITELLIPYSNSNISLYNYITGEYEFLSHSHFLTLLALLLSYKYFNLELFYLSFVGILFWVASFFLLMLLIEFFLKKSKADNTTYICSIIMTATGFGTITSDFPWLLVMFEYVYFFHAIVLMFLFYLHMKGKISNIIFYLSLIWCCLFSETIGFVAVLSVLFCSVAFLLFKVDGYSFKNSFFILFCIGATLCFQYFFIGIGIGSGGQSKLLTIFALYKSPLDAFNMLFSSFTQPLIDASILKAQFGSHYKLAKFIFGICLMTLFVYLSFVTLIHKKIETKPLVILMFSYSLGACVLIMISRYGDFGADVLDAQRFTRLFSLYYVAIGFLYTCLPGHKKLKSITSMLMFCLFTISAYYQHTNAHYVISYFDDIKNEMRDFNSNSHLDEKVGRCSDNYCDTAIEFMKDNHLSVYK
ncbi:hypothetical protein [Aeromonas veronii]|uniref:hypothetical protein n=1 Tax=Aeromonas veronii TaxID=654 RepID=UPI003D1D6B4E